MAKHFCYIIRIAALCLLLTACGAPECSIEHNSCEMQELSKYLYKHISASPYASAEIIIKDYKGEQLETEWREPAAFMFEGEADITWRFYNSLAEMETGLNEAAQQETDGDSPHFLYYTFPLTENDHVLDLYHNLKERFDTKEHPLSAWSADDGKMFHFIQETTKEEDGRILSLHFSLVREDEKEEVSFSEDFDYTDFIDGFRSAGYP